MAATCIQPRTQQVPNMPTMKTWNASINPPNGGSTTDESHSSCNTPHIRESMLSRFGEGGNGLVDRGSTNDLRFDHDLDCTVDPVACITQPRRQLIERERVRMHR